MKKLFFALLTAVAVSFALSSCGSSNAPTPIDSLIDQMISVVDYAAEIQNNEEMQTTDCITVLMNKMKALKDFAAENADYELTDADREKLKEFMKVYGEKVSITPTEEEIAQVDEFKYLHEIVDEMGF